MGTGTFCGKSISSANFITPMTFTFFFMDKLVFTRNRGVVFFPLHATIVNNQKRQRVTFSYEHGAVFVTAKGGCVYFVCFPLRIGKYL